MMMDKSDRTLMSEIPSPAPLLHYKVGVGGEFVGEPGREGAVGGAFVASFNDDGQVRSDAHVRNTIPSSPFALQGRCWRRVRWRTGPRRCRWRCICSVLQ